IFHEQFLLEPFWSAGFRGLRLTMQRLSGTLDGKSLFLQQMLVAQQELNAFATIEPMSGAGLLRCKTGKLSLPVAQNIGLHGQQLAHFTDLKVQLVRDLRSSGL